MIKKTTLAFSEAVAVADSKTGNVLVQLWHRVLPISCFANGPSVGGQNTSADVASGWD